MMLSNEVVRVMPWTLICSMASGSERPSRMGLLIIRAAVRMGVPMPSPKKKTNLFVASLALGFGAATTSYTFRTERLTPSTSSTASTTYLPGKSKERFRAVSPNNSSDDGVPDSVPLPCFCMVFSNVCVTFEPLMVKLRSLGATLAGI